MSRTRDEGEARKEQKEIRTHIPLEKTNLRNVIMFDGTVLFIELALKKQKTGCHSPPLYIPLHVIPLPVHPPFRNTGDEEFILSNKNPLQNY
jgi:hypothetical protein